ncbi:MAG: ISAs1 family transposase [Candidatus Competibacter sp.]|nr:ISAs1 family transposase [Candidatus Competibacter sp.]MDG4585440.1 ISAs1 family transposase [Candidatus Competibacter sp.]
MLINQFILPSFQIIGCTDAIADFSPAIPDHRRPQGRRYRLEHVLLFSILAILSDASSYRKIQRFIAARLLRLSVLCRVQHWKRAPAHTAIRHTVQGLDPAAVEAVFRGHAAVLAGSSDGLTGVALDGKTLRGGFDRFQDRKALQILSALTTDRTLILGHVLIGAADKSHEIPAARQLIDELGLSGRLFTLDALHCQKNG